MGVIFSYICVPKISVISSTEGWRRQYSTGDKYHRRQLHPILFGLQGGGHGGTKPTQGISLDLLPNIKLLVDGGVPYLWAYLCQVSDDDGYKTMVYFGGIYPTQKNVRGKEYCSGLQEVPI